VTDVDAQLRTVPARSARALVGNSAGGFCALNLGLRHRDVFAGIGDLSGYDHPTYDAGMVGLFGRRRDLAATVLAETPSAYAPRLASTPRMLVWLDSGRGDPLPMREVSRLARVLSRDGEAVVLRVRPGGHDYGVWRPALADSLDWLASQLQPRSPLPLSYPRPAPAARSAR